MRRTTLFLFAASLLVAQNPNTAVYPGAVVTDEKLGVAKDRSESELTAGIDALTLSVPVKEGSQFLGYQIVTVDNERMQICSVAGNTLTICAGGRGFSDSTAASHATGARVRAQITAWMDNQAAAEIKAIQGALGANLGNVEKPANKNQPSGYAGLDASARLLDAQVAQSNVTQHQAALALGAGQVTSGTFDTARIPNLDASKISSGSLADARIAQSNVTQHQGALTLGANQTTSGTFDAARIPNLDAGKITSGTFDNARIAQSNVTQHQAALALGASQISSGTFDAARIPNLDAGKITSGSLDAARIPSLDASKIGSGLMAAARGGTGADLSAAAGVLKIAAGVASTVTGTPTDCVKVDGSSGACGTGGGGDHNLLSATHPDTVAASPVLGDLIIANSTPAWTKLAGNTETTKKYLTQTGTGAISAAPAWSALAAADIPTLDAAKITSGTFPASRGGTNNAFFQVSGPATTTRTYTFPNADTTVLTTNAAVTAAQGGTGQSTTPTTGRFLKGDGANWGTSSGSASGTGSCTNQFVRTLNSDAAPTCATVSLTADITGTLAAGNGGTGNAFFSVSGPASSIKTFTFPNASATVLTSNAAVTSAQGGTGANNTATTDRYLKGNGTNFITSSGAASGTGSCTNQFVRTLNSDAAPTCATVGAADVAISSPSSGQLSGVASANLAAANKTSQVTYAFFDPTVDIPDTYDIPSIHPNRAQAITITEVWCETNVANGAVINLQRDDGSPANILSSNLTCTTTGASTTSFVAGEASLAVGHNIDHVTVSVAAGLRRVNVAIKFTVD